MTDAERNAQLEEENAKLRAENELLRQKVDLLVRKVFGSSSEKLDPDQLQLLLDPDAIRVQSMFQCCTADEVAHVELFGGHTAGAVVFRRTARLNDRSYSGQGSLDFGDLEPVVLSK